METTIIFLSYIRINHLVESNLGAEMLILAEVVPIIIVIA